MNKPCRCRTLARVIGLAAMAGFGGTPALADHGDVHDWVNPDGGNYYSSSNWDPPLAVHPLVRPAPGEDDTARFNLAGSYELSFRASSPVSDTVPAPNPLNHQLFVRHDEVLFDLFDSGGSGFGFWTLNRTYRLASDGEGADASVVLGQGSHLSTFGLPRGNTGQLTITGGTLAGVDAVLGLDRSPSFVFPGWRSTGHLIVASEATADFSRSAFMGYRGAGTIDVEEDGALISNRAYLGHDSGANGAVRVTGAEASWTSSGELHVGHAGSGTVEVAAGSAIITGRTYVGYETGGSGTIDITGDETTWSSDGRLDVGYEGTGTANLGQGAVIEASVAVILGSEAGGEGTLYLTGSSTTLTVTDSLTVGRFGTGTMNITDGTMSTGETWIAAGPGSTGTVTLTRDAAFPAWTNGGILAVGGSAFAAGGSGLLSIAPGALVQTSALLVWDQGQVTGGRIYAGEVEIRGGSISQGAGGQLIISDDGQTPSAGTFIGIANGHGSLVISGGGVLETVGAAVIGDDAGSTGEVVLRDPGSRWDHSASLQVGNRGTGMLGVQSGAVLDVQQTLVVRGGSELRYEGGSIRAGILSLTGGGQAVLGQGRNKVLRVDRLHIADAEGSYLDLADNFLIIEYADQDNPLMQVRQWINSGRADGTWDGPEINSSAAAASSGLALLALDNAQAGLSEFGGVEVSKESVLVTMGLLGDANLDGRVDGEDFLIWQASFGTQSGASWTDGDFNLDERVDGEDFLIWQANFGAVMNSTAVTPEPAAGGLLVLAGLLFRRRRSRKS